jgi:predicted acylesterase/phospholipase RssA
LNDLSQFAVEIRSKRLFQLSSKEEKGNELRNIGITTINTSDAVAMSACFPIAFEPIVLSTDSTGLDRSVLGPNHRVADGGIVDNCAIRMANAMQSPRSEGHIFLISDAGKIFDDLDPQEERTSTVISPMRTIDYLMDQNANAQLSKLSRQNERVATIKLTDARRLLDAQELPVDAGLVRATLRIRTNFDAFTFSEIVALYRFGIALSKHVWEQDLGEEAVQVDGNGLLASEHLAGSSLNAVWRDIAIKTRPSGFEEFVEFLLLKPGVALASIALILFAALLAMGAGLRALLSVN